MDEDPSRGKYLTPLSPDLESRPASSRQFDGRWPMPYAKCLRLQGAFLALNPLAGDVRATS